MNIRSALVIALASLLSACPGGATQSVGWRTERVENWQESNHYVRLQYPVVIGANAARFNPVIQHWIGAHCAALNSPGEAYADAKACLTSLVKDCSYVDDPKTTPPPQIACTVDLTADVMLDAAGLLAIKMTLERYGGGAHEQIEIHDLNLDLQSGSALKLNDLLYRADTGTLSLRITHALRAQRHIPNDQPLTQSGLFMDQLPVPENVMALPEGLLFTYQSYEIAPFADGQPQVLVPYADLSDMVRETGPLPRLQALLATAK